MEELANLWPNTGTTIGRGVLTVVNILFLGAIACISGYAIFTVIDSVVTRFKFGPVPQNIAWQRGQVSQAG